MERTKKRIGAGTLALAILLTSPAFTQQAAAPFSAAAVATGDTSPAAMEVMAFERKMESAVVAGDVDYVRSILADDFVMVHSDEWTTGGNPRVVDTKESFLQRVAMKNYLVRDLDSVRAEMHGDIAITYGHLLGEEGVQRKWFSLWYERVYARRNGRWMYVSHRTVHGPVSGPDRDSVKGK